MPDPMLGTPEPFANRVVEAVAELRDNRSGDLHSVSRLGPVDREVGFRGQFLEQAPPVR